MRWRTVPAWVWPYPDSPGRSASPFGRVSLSDTLALLEAELEFIGAVGPFALHVVTGDVGIRRDGAPLRRSWMRHPGIAVSFRNPESTIVVLRCDRFGGRRRGWLANLRAIAVGLQAVRQHRLPGGERRPGGAKSVRLLGHSG